MVPCRIGPGTPLQRQVLRILGDPQLRSNLGMKGAAPGGSAPYSAAAQDEIAALRAANAALMQNAEAASENSDTGALKSRASQAEEQVCATK